MSKLSELAAKLVLLEDQKKELEDDLSAKNKEITELRTVTMPKLMEDLDETGFKCPAGTVFLQNKLYTSVLADDREALYKWFKGNKLGALIKAHVFPQTLTAWAKEMLENGKPLPPLVKATFIPTASIRRAKSNGK